VFGREKADLATYGKVARLAVCRSESWAGEGQRFLDALDGGSVEFWRRSPGRRSALPLCGQLSCAIRLALAALAPCSSALRKDGPELQRGLKLAHGPVRKSASTILPRRCRRRLGLRHFASWFIVRASHDAAVATLFFAYMRRHGVHIWEAGGS